MPLDSPFTLGPFSVDETGRLFPTTEGRFPTFSLRWRQHLVEAAMERIEGQRGTLVLTVRAGWVGSTADDPPAVSQPRRERTFGAVQALASLLPTGWRMHLGADHAIRLKCQAPLDMPVGAVTLLAEVTTALLAAAPYLEVLTEVGVAPGTAKT